MWGWPISCCSEACLLKPTVNAVMWVCVYHMINQYGMVGQGRRSNNQTTTNEIIWNMWCRLVPEGGLEPPTWGLWFLRSNQLSYSGKKNISCNVTRRGYKYSGSRELLCTADVKLWFESREREFRLRDACQLLYFAAVQSGPACVTRKVKVVSFFCKWEKTENS